MGEIDQGGPQEQPSHIGPGVTEVHLPGVAPWPLLSGLAFSLLRLFATPGCGSFAKQVWLDFCATLSAGHLVLLLQ
jgi:hypothetical protein